MPIYVSSTFAPGNLQPPMHRFEIGEFFVTIFHAARRVSEGDQRLVLAAAQDLIGCLGDNRGMFVNQTHPSTPGENTQGSQFDGSKAQVHPLDDARLAHYHIELIGPQRDTPFTTTEIDKIKLILKRHGWS